MDGLTRLQYENRELLNKTQSYAACTNEQWNRGNCKQQRENRNTARTVTYSAERRRFAGGFIGRRDFDVDLNFSEFRDCQNLREIGRTSWQTGRQSLGFVLATSAKRRFQPIPADKNTVQSKPRRSSRANSYEVMKCGITCFVATSALLKTKRVATMTLPGRGFECIAYSYS